MRTGFAWLLPALTLALLAGIVTADALAIAVSGWQLVALGFALATPLVGRSASGVAVCAVGLAIALGGVRIATPLEAAGASAVDRAFDAGVDAWVCEVRHDPAWVRATLCDAVAVRVGGEAEGWRAGGEGVRRKRK